MSVARASLRRRTPISRHAEERSAPMEEAFVRAQGNLALMMAPLAGLATGALRRQGWSDAEIEAR